jgi:hypothetical protein
VQDLAVSNVTLADIFPSWSEIASSTDPVITRLVPRWLHSVPDGITASTAPFPTIATPLSACSRDESVVVRASIQASSNCRHSVRAFVCVSFFCVL